MGSYCLVFNWSCTMNDECGLDFAKSTCKLTGGKQNTLCLTRRSLEETIAYYRSLAKDDRV